MAFWEITGEDLGFVETKRRRRMNWGFCRFNWPHKEEGGAYLWWRILQSSKLWGHVMAYVSGGQGVSPTLNEIGRLHQGWYWSHMMYIIYLPDLRVTEMARGVGSTRSCGPHLLCNGSDLLVTLGEHVSVQKELVDLRWNPPQALVVDWRHTLKLVKNLCGVILSAQQRVALCYYQLFNIKFSVLETITTPQILKWDLLVCHMI